MQQVQVYDVLKKGQRITEAATGEQVEQAGGALEPGLDNRVILLKAEQQDRVLPIWVGPFEGDAIAIHLKQEETKRPLTFDLVKTLLGLGQVVVERAVVARLHEITYYSNLTVKTGATTSEVDCRPSDAINLALRLGVPIFVAEEVMEQEHENLPATVSQAAH